MQNIVEERNSMCEKILTDLQTIFNGDEDLKEFTIVPITESRNKSPVLYEEHSLGLESWCVKHLYHYIYTELFQLKAIFKKNRLPEHRVKEINKLLITALLLHPDVSTFWNMRRELIEKGLINVDKEFVLTKLILSHNSKSNECFSYKKWILCKLMKNIAGNDITELLNKEFAVTEMAAEKSQNNYHAWTHRIWCIQSMISKSELLETDSFLNIILNELDFSNMWINKHVSEHAGFHYRQYLCKKILNNGVRTFAHDIKYHFLIEPFIGVKFSNCDNVTYLNNLLGKQETINSNNNILLKCYNYVYYFIILLSDLFYYIEQLNETFPGHEAIWYHRRFVIFSLLKGAYDYHGLTWKCTFKLDDSHIIDNDLNITTTNVKSIYGTGEKSAKLLKYETDRVESSYLYKLLLECEIKFIKENSSNKTSCVQKELALRHEKWLKLVLGINKICD